MMEMDEHVLSKLKNGRTDEEEDEGGEREREMEMEREEERRKGGHEGEFSSRDGREERGFCELCSGCGRRE